MRVGDGESHHLLDSLKRSFLFLLTGFLYREHIRYLILRDKKQAFVVFLRL